MGRMSDKLRRRLSLRRRPFPRDGHSKSVFWCHCQSCRRHSGAPVSVFVGFELGAYTVTKGEITKFKSSPGTTRGFCRSCGATLTCEVDQLPTETHFHVGAFDEPGRFRALEAFLSQRAAALAAFEVSASAAYLTALQAFAGSQVSGTTSCSVPA